MGAAHSSLGRTKVLYATYLVLLGAKAKFLRRKFKVLVALDEMSEIIMLTPIHVLCDCLIYQDICSICSERIAQYKTVFLASRNSCE